MTGLTATLRAIWKGGSRGYRYDVTLKGERIVSLSRDPETDLARALLRRGITGIVTLRDGKTGKPRTIVNIERAAKLYLSEEDRDGLRYRKHKKNPDISQPAPERGPLRVSLATGSRGQDLGHYPGSKLEISPQQQSKQARDQVGQTDREVCMIARKTDAQSLYVTEGELARRLLGDTGARRWANIVSVLEREGLPEIDPLMGGRFWPAVEALFARRHGLRLEQVPRSADGQEVWQ